MNLAKSAAITICTMAHHLHRPAKGKPPCRLARPASERLSVLRSVDPKQTNSLRFPLNQHLHCVAIDNSDDLSLETLSQDQRR